MSKVIIILSLLLCLKSHGSIKLTISATIIDSEAVIPDSVFDNIQVDTLIITNCPIPVFPAKVSELVNLKYLDLSGSAFEFVAVDSLKVLEVLKVSLTQIKNVPRGMCSLKSLRGVDLSKTFITMVPDEIGDLVNLELLKLNNTYLQKIPVTLGKLNRLEELWLINTKIDFIPLELTEIRNLQYLWVYWSDIVNAKEVISGFHEKNPAVFFGRSNRDY